MSKEIEGLKNLCRFLAKYQDDLRDVRSKALKADDIKGYLMMRWPCVQGLQNILNLKKIAQQKMDNDKIHDGVKSMLEDKPKRTPDKNGVLPLTKKELREFEELVGHKVCSVVIVKDTLIPHFLCFKTPEMTLLYCNTLISFKAILWLAERFELEG